MCIAQAATSDPMDVLLLLAEEKYTETFSKVKDSDDIVLSYIAAILYDKGYGTPMRPNMHYEMMAKLKQLFIGNSPKETQV